jgi:hypothetical protein
LTFSPGEKLTGKGEGVSTSQVYLEAEKEEEMLCE